jgi:aldehyde:ferredoxin oxidoreductase
MEGMHDTMLGMDAPTPELGVTQSADRLSLSGKAELAVLYENLRSFTNSLVMCAFTNNMVGASYNYPAIRELLEYTTGVSLTAADMLTIGARNFDLMRLYSGMAGFRREHDDLPERFYAPLPRGGSSGRAITPEAFQEELDSYYTLRGWDSYGPTDEHLHACELKDLCSRISRLESFPSS